MQKLKEKVMYRVFRILRWLVKLFYPKLQVFGAERLPERPFVVVGNHAKMNGPIACELYFPGERAIWCAGEMMRLREVPDYAFSDFWSAKPRWSRWFYRLLSYVIAPFSVCVFRSAHTIPVYHDARIASAFRATMKRLDEGAAIIIFPEGKAPHNHILNAFQENFIDVARFYYRRAGRALSFVPAYVSPACGGLYLGEPVEFDPSRPIAGERRRLCAALADAITALAEALPPHTVIPYDNIPKKDYPVNRQTNERS